MVNLSPTEESYNESYCSLKFAQQVNQCELGKPKRQIKDCKDSKDKDGSVGTEPMDTQESQTPSRSVPTSTSGTASKLKRTATATKTTTSRVKTTH